MFIVWDGDKDGNDAKAADNHRVLRLVTENTQDWPASQVGRNFACFEYTPEALIRDEIGAGLFDELLKSCQDTLCFPKKKHAVKNPVIIATIITEAKKYGKTSNTVEKIVESIIMLKGGVQT